MVDTTLMKQKLSEAMDPDNEYTYEEFMSEYNKIEHQQMDVPKFDFHFVNKSDNEDPKYATNGSSGFDLRANLKEPITLSTGERALIPTGLHFGLPPNFEIQVRPRSGLAYKHGVTVLNSPGTVDADYRGDVGVILINHGQEDFIINHGERIAQGVIATVMSDAIINLKKVAALAIDHTNERGEGGFGHTGTK